MRNRKNLSALPAAVGRLGARIERWRRTRERRTAMPAELWSEAAALARSEGIHPISRTLGISYDMLKRKLALRPVEPDRFLDLTGAQLLGAATPMFGSLQPQDSGCFPSPPVPVAVVEMVDDSGIRVTVRLARESEVDVVDLVSAFRRGERGQSGRRQRRA